MSFSPPVADYGSGWTLFPFGTTGVDPTEVVPHGATHLHTIGVDGYVRYTGREGSMTLHPTDAPIVSMGLLSPFPTPGRYYGRPIDSGLRGLMEKGVHVNLHNNVWNTNYPEWYPFVPGDADSRFRFALSVREAP